MKGPDKAPDALARDQVDAAVAPLLELLGLSVADWQRDVLSLHLTRGTASVRTQARTSRGRILHGVTVRQAHRIVDELDD